MLQQKSDIFVGIKDKELDAKVDTALDNYEAYAEEHGSSPKNPYDGAITVDNIKQLFRIDAIAGDRGIRPRIVLQINSAAEQDEVKALIRSQRKCVNLKVIGYKCIDAEIDNTR